MASAFLQSFWEAFLLFPEEGRGSSSGPISCGPLARVVRIASGPSTFRNAQDLVAADDQQASQCDDDYKRPIAIANAYGRCMGDLCQQGLQTLQEEIFECGDTVLAAIAIQYALEWNLCWQTRGQIVAGKRHVQLRPCLC